MKNWVVGLLVLILGSHAWAGNVGMVNNHSVEYNQTMSRFVSRDLDAVFYNPGAVASLGEGLSLAISNQIWQLGASIEYAEGTYEDTYLLPYYLSAIAAYHQDNWAVFLATSPVGTTTSVQASSETVKNAAHPFLWAIPESLGLRLEPTKYNVIAGGLLYGVDLGGSLELNDWISLGAGMRWNISRTKLELDIEYEGGIIAVDSLATASGSGFSPMLGVSLHPFEGTDMSLLYRGRSVVESVFDTERDIVRVGGVERESGTLEDGRSWRRDVPASMSFGLGYEVTSDVRITLSSEYWFNKQAYWGELIPTEGEEDKNALADYEDGMCSALGLEWTYSEKVDLGFGLHFTKSGAGPEARNEVEGNTDKVTVASGLNYWISPSTKLGIALVFANFAEGKDDEEKFTYRGWIGGGALGITTHLPL